MLRMEVPYELLRIAINTYNVRYGSVHFDDTPVLRGVFSIFLKKTQQASINPIQLLSYIIDYKAYKNRQIAIKTNDLVKCDIYIQSFVNYNQHFDKYSYYNDMDNYLIKYCKMWFDGLADFDVDSYEHELVVGFLDPYNDPKKEAIRQKVLEKELTIQRISRCLLVVGDKLDPRYVMCKDMHYPMLDYYKGTLDLENYKELYELING